MAKTGKKKIEYFNKKARFDYKILDSFEAGMVLLGDEIKGVRGGKVNMTGSYVKIVGGELFWLGGIINMPNIDQQRTRKLLMHKEEIAKLIGKTDEKGLSLVPLKMYITRGKAKLEVGIAKGMTKYDKRSKMKERDVQREIERNT